ncbi:hypothetical protein MPSI1_000088 [Malassezia psittaci]|uniref:Uncharacterized protein n=1 Tax=Malassezia psittaci TaxID=1821823 RepID=A0AAF0JI80_9BASI|nr:hypothetical protein MPSI1_000088 [Malassezia psittaci]
MQTTALHRLIATAKELSPAEGVGITLRRAYGALFACLELDEVCAPLCTLLSLLTERCHVRAFRIRRVRALYATSNRHKAIYALLDTFATFAPALLLPVERAASASRRGGKNTTLEPVRVVRWARTIHSLILPEMVPGLCTHVGDSCVSCVPQFLHLARLIGVGSHGTDFDSLNKEVGAKLAASLGRLTAVNYVYRQRHQSPPEGHRKIPADIGIPPFDPVASVMLDQVYVRCAHMNQVPPTLVSFLAHVVHSMGTDALSHLQDPHIGTLHRWEQAWRPTLEILARILGYLFPVAWDDVFTPLLRPLCHIATMDGVSDDVSAIIFRTLVRLLRRWNSVGAHDDRARSNAEALWSWLLELEEALLMEGNPSLCLYAAALQLHQPTTKSQNNATLNALYPFPFYTFAAPVALHGSIATLAPLFGLVNDLRMRIHSESLPATPINEMILALVDMVWSGRAYGSLLQHGLHLDGHLVIDSQTFATIKQACDARRLVPFVLVGSLSHSALLAPLFEVYCNEVLLQGDHPFVKAPITPSALRPVREKYLPVHTHYTNIRQGFLQWLAARGAPELWTLLEATVPSLRKTS